MTDSLARPYRRRFAVMGHPVRHSKSPVIHRRFAAQFGIEIEYTAIDVAPGTFPEAVAAFREAGGDGLNVTLPFKIEAFALADRHSDRAAQAGAANTLKFEDRGIFADNTDGVGLVRDLTANLGRTLAGARVLVLGAGGAVSGILGPLLAEGPRQVVIANRTVARAEALCRRFAGAGSVVAAGFHDLAGHTFDLVIHGTAASLAGELPPLPAGLFAPGALAYDLMYADRPTPFMAWARTHGAQQVADGLGMLVEQAAESFYVWLGRRPATAPVIAGLRPTPSG